MKILLTIHHNLDPDTGAPGSTLKLGQEYQNLGHQVEYYSFDNLPSWIHAKVKSLVFAWFVAVHIANLCRRQAVEIVDASTGNAWIWAKMRRKSRAKPPLLVTRSHGLEHIVHLEQLESAKQGKLRLSWKYPLYHGGYRLWEVATSMRYADLVFQRNHHDLEYATEQLGIKPEQSHVVPYGIPETFINLPFEPLLASAPIAIALVATYLPRKGIDYSIPALNTILERYPQITVSMLGTACPAEQVYADFKPELRDRVHVIPHYHHDQLPTLLQGHQIKLFPSLAEGFGIVLIEAMACGLAPITTAIDGPKEIVRDGQDGILIPPRDRLAIEQALERLISDRPYLEQLRRQAYTTAQNYSWTAVARQQLALYEKALNISSQDQFNLNQEKVS
jgi:glycosyltransferase involved in cell wall biosynthesis